MSLIRGIACLLFPPLAVIDKGCGSILIVFVLSVLGWLPGVIAAVVFCMRDTDERNRAGDAQIALGLILIAAAASAIVYGCSQSFKTVGAAVEKTNASHSAAASTPETLEAPIPTPSPVAEPTLTTDPTATPDPVTAGGKANLIAEKSITLPHGIVRLKAGTLVNVKSVSGSTVTVEAMGETFGVERSELTH